MNKKVVTLLKMLILSLGLIVAVTLFSKDKEVSVDESGKTSYGFAMGTSISVSIYDKDADESRITESINKEIKTLDEELISWRAAGSELKLLNDNYTMAQGYEISPEFLAILKQSLALCTDSNGALDITIRPLASLWNIEGDTDEEFVPPKDDEIEEALEYVGYDKVQILAESYSDGAKEVVEEKYYAYLSAENMTLDLGATGKGYALDKAREILDEAQVEGALVTVGGSILIYGKKSSGETWKIGVRDPLKPSDTSAMIGYLEFSPGTVICVSTSGGYEKYKTYEGKDYHHILDSKTGYPSDSGLLSVTVVCENGLVSDGLSTACYVLGYEKSLPLLEKYNAEAVFMDSEGNITVTDRLKDSWIEN